MRVCIVTDYLPGYHRIWSGAELIAEALAEMLYDRGCEVAIITTPFDFSGQANSRYKVYPVRTPLKNLGIASRNFPIDMVAIRDLGVLLKKIAPDIVHVNAKYLYLASIIASRRRGIPTVFTVPDYFMFCPTTFIRRPNGDECSSYHGGECCECLSSLSNQRLRKLILSVPRFIVKAPLRLRSWEFDRYNKKVDHFVALSNVSRRRLIDYGIPEGKVSVIYHYRLMEPAPTDVHIEGPAVVFAGWLSKENGVDILLDGFLDAMSVDRRAKLYLIGTGQDEFVGRLRQTVEKKGANGNVVFLGKRKNAEVLSIIANCNFAVIAHQWAKEFGPVILLEALAMGKPVIASRIGATEEYVRDGQTGFLISRYRDPSAFSEKIAFLLGNPQIALRMGRQAKESVSFLFDGSPGERMIELYKTLIN